MWPREYSDWTRCYRRHSANNLPNYRGTLEIIPKGSLFRLRSNSRLSLTHSLSPSLHLEWIYNFTYLLDFLSLVGFQVRLHRKTISRVGRVSWPPSKIAHVVSWTPVDRPWLFSTWLEEAMRGAFFSTTKMINVQTSQHNCARTAAAAASGCCLRSNVKSSNLKSLRIPFVHKGTRLTNLWI